MSPNSQIPFESSKRSLHSASGFGKPSHPPFPELSKSERDDAMDALMKSLQDINEATLGREKTD